MPWTVRILRPCIMDSQLCPSSIYPGSQVSQASNHDSRRSRTLSKNQCNLSTVLHLYHYPVRARQPATAYHCEDQARCGFVASEAEDRSFGIASGCAEAGACVSHKQEEYSIRGFGPTSLSQPSLNVFTTYPIEQMGRHRTFLLCRRGINMTDRSYVTDECSSPRTPALTTVSCPACGHLITATMLPTHRSVGNSGRHGQEVPYLRVASSLCCGLHVL